MEKVIVTGANGFVGSKVVKELSAQGVRVWAVVKNEQAKIDDIVKLPNVQIIYCELSEIKSLPSRIAERNFDVFYHFAWMGTSGADRGNDALQIQNITATCDAVRAGGKLGSRRFIFAASIMEYECIALMQTEKAPAVGTLYSTAKLSADFMAKILCAQLGIDYISAVISNIYGPGEGGQRFITKTLRMIQNKESLAFTPGEQMYDFIHIEDAAKAFVALGLRGKPRKRYYIGTQSPRPLKSFLFELRDQIDPDLELGLGKIPFDGVSLDYYQQFDLTALKDDTGVQATIPFRDGINEVWEYMGGGSGSFRFEPLRLDGLILIAPLYAPDRRGYFLKNYEKEIFSKNGIDTELFESFETRSCKGVIRGLHYQKYKPQAKLVRAVQGTIFDVAVDLRPDSKTFGQWQGVYLDSCAHQSLFIPKGFAHGFLVLSDSALVSYQCVGQYLPEFDSGIRWDDPKIGIKWPLDLVDTPILSQKDQNWPTLEEQKIV